MAGILRNRPLLLLAIGLILGLSWREYPWNPLFALPILVAIADWRKSTPLVLGLSLGFAFSPSLPKAGLEEAAYLESEARVATVPRIYPDRISYIADVQGKRVAIAETVRADRSLGDLIRLKGVARPLSEGSEQTMLARGVVARMTPIAVESVGQGLQWYRSAAWVRKSFLAYSRSILSAEQAVLLDALCFNVEGGLESDFEESLRKTGTIHIISASGLHALVLAWAIDALLGLLPIPRPARLAILGVLLAFYAAAAGLQPAIVRSVVMSMVALSAYLWKRESDLLSGLALASILYLAWEPLGVYNIGFQFSFLTVAAFALFGRLTEEPPGTAKASVKETLASALQTTAVAYIATLPLLAFYFGAVSLVAVPANMLILPAAMALVALGMGGFVLHFMFPGLSEILANSLISPLLAYLESAVGYFGNLRIASLPLPGFEGYWLLPVYAVLLAWVREGVRPA